VSERERQEQFEELTLLQTRGSELCHAIVGAPRVRNHFSEGMQLVADRVEVPDLSVSGDTLDLWK
jgi:hypothetical protein